MRSLAKARICCLESRPVKWSMCSVLLVDHSRSGREVNVYSWWAAVLAWYLDYIVSTDDGSAGRSGFVTDNLNDFLDWPDQVFACGPVPMLKAMKRVEFTAGLEIQIAMEERMGCAMGVCLGCVIGTRGGPQRVCRDGPVFDIKEMLW